MSSSYSVVVGRDGEVVLKEGWSAGTVLVARRTESGLLLDTRAALLERVQSGLAGTDLVGELLAERRAEARREDA